MIFARRAASALAATARPTAQSPDADDAATEPPAPWPASPRPARSAVLLGSSDTFAAGAGRDDAPRRPLPRAVDSAAIVVNGIFSGFEPNTVDLNPGGTLTVTNNDTMTHTFTSQAIDGNGDPLFDVRVPAGTTRSIPVSGLGGGTYGFYCRIHPQMTGTLTIEGPPTGQPTTVPEFEQRSSSPAASPVTTSGS